MQWLVRNKGVFLLRSCQWLLYFKKRRYKKNKGKWILPISLGTFFDINNLCHKPNTTNVLNATYGNDFAICFPTYATIFNLPHPYIRSFYRCLCQKFCQIKLPPLTLITPQTPITHTNHTTNSHHSHQSHMMSYNIKVKGTSEPSLLRHAHRSLQQTLPFS